MIVAITGTPCTGKSTLAKALEAKGFHRIDVNALIKQRKLSGGYDRKRQCYVVDTAKLNRLLLHIIRWARQEKRNVVIDSHLSHYLPSKAIDRCIVTTCDLKVLKRRLQKRGYSKAKIAENLECEIMGVCENEARERGHRVWVMDMTKGAKRGNVKSTILRKITQSRR